MSGRLSEYFPDLNLKDFKLLCFIAWLGEIPDPGVLKALTGISAHRKSEILSGIERLKSCRYLYGNGVSPEYFFHAVEVMMECGSQWESDFSKTDFFRYESSVYLWTFAKYVALKDFSAAAALPRNQYMTDTSLHLERYAGEAICEEGHEELIDALTEKERAALFGHVLYRRLRKDRVDGEFLSHLRQLSEKYLPANQDVIGEIELYRYLTAGMQPRFSDNGRSQWEYCYAAIRDLYIGNLYGALKGFSAALKEHDRHSETKGAFENPLLAFFYAICLIRCTESPDFAEGAVPAELRQKFLKSRLVYFGKELAAVRILLTYSQPQYRNGGEFAAKEIERMIHEDDCCLTRIFADILVRYFRCESLVPESGCQCHASVFRFEFSSYYPLHPDERNHLKGLYGTVPLLDMFKRKESWEYVFSDISKSILSDVKPEKRIIYFLDGLDISGIIEQTGTDGGGWNSGTLLSLQKFMAEGYDSMSDVDKKIAWELGRRSRGYRDADILLACIPDHDRIFKGQAYPYLYPYEPVTVCHEQPYVEFVVDGDSICVSSNIAYEDLSDGCCSRTVMKEDGSYVTVSFDECQRSILAGLLSTGPLPVRASSEIRMLAEKLSGILEIRLDLPPDDPAQMIEGSGMIAVRIIPDSRKTYHAHISSAPLPDGNLRCNPGYGDEVVAFQTEDGLKMVQRDFHAESENYQRLQDFIMASIGDVFVGRRRLEFSSPESVLKLLEFIKDYDDFYFAEWPEGGTMTFCGTINTSDINVQVCSDMDWFKVEGTVNISGNTLSYQELLLHFGEEDAEGYVRIRGNEYARLSDMLREHIRKMDSILSDAARKKGVCRVEKYDVGLLADILGQDGGLHAEMDEKFIRLLDRMETIYRNDVQVPDGLCAELRDYQKKGFEWLVRLSEWGAGACLADDMGLGKTLQTIAMLLYRKDRGPSLVAAPKSVLHNWNHEIRRFAPGLDPVMMAAEKDGRKIVREAGSGDVVIVSYGMLASRSGLLSSRTWNVVCLDEAHYIKNRTTRTSAAAMNLKSDARVILTGTPLQNHLGELWNLFQFINPGMLGPWPHFMDKYIRTPFDGDKERELRERISPFVLRRSKYEVLDELPEKISYEKMVTLSPEEMQIYEKIRHDAEVKFKRHKTVAEREKANALDLSFFRELMRLRQLSDSVSLAFPEWTRGSSKISALKDMVLTLGADRSNRTIIFSQFTGFLSQIRVMMAETGMEYFYLDGQTPEDERDRLVCRFQKGECRFFLISLMAGGLGLNLTAANHVILMEPWWNPAVEEQAADRAYRIGQSRNVTVIRLVSANTIEEKMLRLHEKKRMLSDSVLAGTSAGAFLTMDEILDMISPYR